MIWEKLAQEFVVKGTVGDLIVMMFAAFIVGVFCTIFVFYLWILKRQLKEKKKVGDKIKTLILVSMFVLLAAAGCSPIIIGGPFVTDIGYDGEGNLMITKNTIVHDPFWGRISNGGSPQTIVIKSPKR